MDVLEAGDGGSARRRAPRTTRLVAVIAGGALAAAVIAGASQWWLQQEARPDRLEIVRVDAVGPFAISGEDLPDDWPRDLVVGALRLRVEITGDPQRTVRAESAGDTGVYVASGATDTVIPAGENSEVDVVLTPSDCGAIDSATSDEAASPLIDASGAAIPLGADASRTLDAALASLCPTAELAPAVSSNSVRVDVFFRDRTLVMRARVATVGERVVLQPRDSVGFRGRGEQEATIEDGVATARLRWLISPAEAEGLASPTVRVRVFTVTAGRGYPWVLDLRVPAGFTRDLPSEPRNDGVDLAEVAPRPSN